MISRIKPQSSQQTGLIKATTEWLCRRSYNSPMRGLPLRLYGIHAIKPPTQVCNHNIVIINAKPRLHGNESQGLFHTVPKLTPVTQHGHAHGPTILGDSESGLVGQEEMRITKVGLRWNVGLTIGKFVAGTSVDTTYLGICRESTKFPLYLCCDLVHGF